MALSSNPNPNPNSNSYAHLPEEQSTTNKSTPQAAQAAAAAAAAPAPASPTTPSNPHLASAAAALGEVRSMPKKIGNPLPTKSLKQRCERAAYVLSDFLTTSQEQALLSDETIRNAKGLVFISMIKAGYIWSGRIGSGLVIAKTKENVWSAPSALSYVGVGYGAQAGLEFTDYVIILKNEQALNAFCQTGNFLIGGSLALAVGPWGRNLSGDLAATCAVTYALSKSRGLFGGLSIEGTVMLENRRVNERCYGSKGLTPRQLLSGEFPPNQDVAILLQALQQRFPPSAASPSPSPAPARAPAPSSSSSPSTPLLAPSSHSAAPLYPTPFDASSPPAYQNGAAGHQRFDEKAGLLSKN